MSYSSLLYSITGYLPSVGGAQRYLHSMTTHLQQHHDLRVVCHWSENRTDWLRGTTVRAPTSDRHYAVDGVPVHQLGLPRAVQRRLWPAVLLYYAFQGWSVGRISDALVDLLAEQLPRHDLVHNIRMGRAGLSVASYKLAHRWGVPFVFSPLHHPRWEGWLYRRYVQLYQQADAVNALTEHEKRVMLRLGVPEQRVFVTGISSSTQDGPLDTSILEQHNIAPPYVLFVGQKYPYKNYETLLEAAPLVWKAHPEVQFVFAGPRTLYSERVFAQVTDKRVTELGVVTDAQKRALLAHCSLLCVPSAQESFGGVYLEAWQYKKAVIGGPAPAVADVIADGQDGFWLPEANTEPLADRIGLLLSDVAQAGAMGEQGYQKTTQRYSIAAVMARVDAMYRAVLPD